MTDPSTFNEMFAKNNKDIYFSLDLWLNKS